MGSARKSAYALKDKYAIAGVGTTPGAGVASAGDADGGSGFLATSAFILPQPGNVLTASEISNA